VEVFASLVDVLSTSGCCNTLNGGLVGTQPASSGNSVGPSDGFNWCSLGPLQIHPPVLELMRQWSLLCSDLPLFLNENRCCRHVVRIISPANLCKAGPVISVLDKTYLPKLTTVYGAQD
jgi:hypothetical protein